VRGEAREAAERNILVPVRFDQARLPMDVRAIHTTDLDGWRDDPASPQAAEFLRALGAMIARSQASRPAKPGGAAPAPTPIKDAPRYTICVLPFVNMSGDPEQDYFAEGIADDIITALAKLRFLFVIARNSSFAYKDKTVAVTDIGRELGVRYVLEGSVRKAGSRLRMTAQLVEAATGVQLWSERYDRELGDLFAVQEEIATSVAIAIRPAIEHSERERAARKPPESLDAWECYQRGMHHLWYQDVSLAQTLKA
jgi:adenylate cyclase